MSVSASSGSRKFASRKPRGNVSTSRHGYGRGWWAGDSLCSASRLTVLMALSQPTLATAAHAHATRLSVSLARDNGHARLVVADDGRGFSPDRLEQRREEGHLGLTLLTGLVAEAGGRLIVDSTPGIGTRLEAEVPVA